MPRDRERCKKTVDTAVRFLAELEKCRFSGVVEIVFQDGGIRGANQVRVIREPVGDVLAASSDAKSRR